MFEGDLRGWRGRSPAGSLETRLKAGGGAGLLASGKSPLVPWVHTPGGRWAGLYGASI